MGAGFGLAALLSAPDNFLFVCPVYRTALPVYCVLERQKGGLNAMKEELLQILTDHPDLLELALRLVVDQARIYGILPEAGRTA